MEAIVNNLGVFILGIVGLVVGFGMMVAGLVDIYKGSSGDTKEFKKIGIGIGIGAFGALIAFLGGSSLVNIFKNASNGIPFQ